jgi:hypothetical protein
MNAFSVTKIALENYTQITLYSNVVSNKVLFPLLIEVIKHKAIVLVILAFI